MSLPSFCRTVLLLAGLSLSGISSGHAADWPRQVTDSRGTHTLEHKPQRIVSTSVTLTGSLLAIDAPVIASGATTPNNRIGDAQGFTPVERSGKRTQTEPPVYRRTERRGRRSSNAGFDSGKRHRGRFCPRAVRSAVHHCANAHH